eukprot:TRINITY_DN2105_c0_g1_i1.p1 TRINITY_DN2105_c0_g1~~TRINITY_DN2105_c0_g1_i1.p1  ORF type:complete len:949 (+),score=251.05 TRINITY_DN2105_c0_g1_i1:394-2847(+)
MDSKRKRQREEIAKKELEEYRKRRPKISEQFLDLKRDLGQMTSSDWLSIPEPKDMTRRNKQLKEKQKVKTYTPVPDTVLNTQSNQYAPALDQRQIQFGGMETPLTGTGTDQRSIGVARNRVLGLKLDRMADSVTGQTVVDPKGYLTDLKSVKVSNEAELSDIKKARLLLKSVISTNPKHAPGWIAAARLEVETGKLVAARELIQKGCEACPTNEDVWLEAARLQTPKNAKSILAKAVKHIPTSVKIWIYAANLEEDASAKKAVLRRALEFIPNSVKLWKTAIELESPEDARIMLGRAVELVPQSVEMWLALARLETYENARKVLNKARSVLPTEPQIWIMAAKLEEAHGNRENVEFIIQKAVKSLAANQVIISRDSWLNDAEACEKSGSKVTCQAIVKATISLGIEEQDRKRTWLNDADHYLAKGSVETSRAIYAHMLSVFRSKKNIWLKAAQLERQYGTKESLNTLLDQAVVYCPQAEVLWLMSAKEKWLAGDVFSARSVLKAAFAANPDSEEIWLAAVKLESENNEYEAARKLLERARERASTARVWMKSAKLERELKERDQEKALLLKGVELFPKSPKLWMMLGQWYSDYKGDYTTAREVYKKAVSQNPDSVDLWLNFANMEATQNVAKARSLLETARMKIQKNPKLWLTAIKIEQKANNQKVAQQLMAKALQECPTAGVLWAHAIASDARPQRKARSYDALKRCSDDAYVFLAVARLFWMDRKTKKTRSWFHRAITADPDLGDAWAYFYKFELEYGDKTSQEAVLKRCVEADPHHGELWVGVSKAIENSRLKTDAILKKAAASIKEIFPNNIS